MIGTIANTSTILLGSLAGSTLRKGIGEKYKAILMDAMGLAASALGINSIVQAMPQSRYHVLFIVSLALGGVIGTRLSLDTAFARALSRISKGSDLAQGLSTAILLYCAGTLSILGPMQSALMGDNTYLFTNAILDGITSIVLSSTFGLGIALAAVVLFCWQGSIYLLAGLIQPFVTESLMTEISLIGGVLILASGLSILGIKQIKTLNLLPALAVPPVVVTVLTMLGI
ncbi:hypothetical protein B5G43_01660 [Flavonifractor sp. An92]|uniref:DUF554 domain-containing protein n=1 Tax=Flavonifractor sp. An92 TaxID=1965666 RepID=UPI000B399DA1|nr:MULTISPECIES: DUF554 domain-containing protein [unclassified Flavonifractor]OUN08116.1 hypothetical protein B5G43_01660 [Flavonifractor sp. An92]OUQ24158.1 hypothetical protein B5E80_07730 [Flavonifractor sp. An135]